jgi:ribosomal protein S17
MRITIAMGWPKTGDLVEIVEETRPISKTKSWA